MCVLMCGEWARYLEAFRRVASRRSDIEMNVCVCVKLCELIVVDVFVSCCVC